MSNQDNRGYNNHRQQQQQQQQHSAPSLHVAIPPPAAYSSSGPRSPYGHQQPQYNNHPRAGFGPSSPSSSAETLVNSPNSYNGGKGDGYNSTKATMMQPPPAIVYPASPSITSFKQAVLDQKLTADPDNDRLMPATPGGSPSNFWKRFSTVVHENEAKEAMAEKTGHRGGRPAGSEWLHRETGGQKKYRYWVGAVAFLIIAAIAGSLVYHFCFKPKDPNAEDENGLTNPTTHDFGLGDGTNGVSEASSSSSSGAAARHRTSSLAESVSEMPSASAVAAGATLRVRSGNNGHSGIGGNGSSHGIQRRRLVDLD